MPDLMWTTDRNLTITTAEGAAMEHIGPSADELVGLSLESIFDSEHEVARAIAAHRRALDGEVNSYDFHHSDRWYVMYVEPLCEYDQLTGCRCIGLDISERKLAEQSLRESEASFRAVFNLAGVGIGQVDPITGQFLRVNARYCEITGYSLDELRNMTYRDVTHPAERDADDVTFQRAVRGEIPEYWSEKRYVRKNGEVIWVMVNAVVIRDENGEPVRSVGIIQDITMRKYLEQQLEERADQERQHLARELHDSLGQQISGLSMLASSLKHELTHGDPSAARNMMETLDANLQQAKNQVRALTKGLCPMHLEGGDLSRALRGLAHETAEMHALACRFEGDEEESPEDSFAATQLFLIAREAVHNAAKHARAQEIVIRLATDNGIRISITDDGIGLPPHLRKQTTHGQSTNGETESGIGIKTMFHRARLIGAELRLESPTAGGTTVCCRLSAFEHQVTDKRALSCQN